jgi:hypothetical protein
MVRHAATANPSRACDRKFMPPKIFTTGLVPDRGFDYLELKRCQPGMAGANNMSRWLLAATFSLCIPGLAAAQQVGNAVNSGLNADSGSMNGPGINIVNGINANGTPRQQSPGASMTNGAGNSTMTPGVTGAPGATGQTTPPPGITTPTLNGHVTTNTQ